MCFVWISEQTAIISLYSINWLVFVAETECVYCAVQTEYLTLIRVTLVFKELILFLTNNFLSLLRPVLLTSNDIQRNKRATFNAEVTSH
jgi:hypothetical protein